MLENGIYTGSCFNVMEVIPTNSIDLVFADPPWNIGYRYDIYNDKLPPAEYAEFTRQWVNLAAAKLKITGAMYVLVGDESAAAVKTALDESGLLFRNWIIWHFNFGTYCEKKFGRCHAHLLYYAKSMAFTWNADAVRIESQRQRNGDKRANAAGKIPSDMWETPNDVWLINRIAGTHAARESHPCQAPEELMARAILASTNPGDIVLDPFCGSGGTLAVAKKHKRRYLGIELSPDYAADAVERLRNIP